MPARADDPRAPPGRATRDDVARHAGVSAATVSYVVNNGPRPVAADTRAKVMNAIAALGYHPDNIARSLRARRSHVLGLVLPDSANLFFAELARRLEQQAAEQGYRLLLCNSQEDVTRERLHLEALRDQRVDGILLIPADAPDAIVPTHVDGVPIIALDRTPSNWTGDAVRTDAHTGGALAADHLIALGHRRIGFLHGPLRLAHARDRLTGGLAALRQAGVPAPERWRHECAFDFAGGWSGTRALCQGPDRPTALCCGNDAIAVGALASLHALGLRVPTDVSVTGFDDVPLAAYAIPPLTTVTQPYDAMAAQALHLALSRATAPSSTLPGAVRTFPVALHVRQSTARPAGACHE